MIGPQGGHPWWVRDNGICGHVWAASMWSSSLAHQDFLVGLETLQGLATGRVSCKKKAWATTRARTLMDRSAFIGHVPMYPRLLHSTQTTLPR